MLCYPWSAQRLTTYNKPYIVQAKLNGERCRVLMTPDGVKLLSSEGNEFNLLPKIQENPFWTALAEYYGGEAEFDGELYCHGISRQEIHSIVSRRVNIHPEVDLIYISLFDTPQLEAEQATRTQTLTEAFNRALYSVGCTEYIKLVSTYCAISLGDIEQYLRHCLNLGYEGVVVKNPSSYYTRARSTNWMKIKPRKFDRYTIVGYTEECDIYGNPKGSLGAFDVCDKDGKTFKVGTGFTACQRATWWEDRTNMLGMDILVYYPTLTNRGIPDNPVFKCLYEKGMPSKGYEEIEEML